MLVAGRQDAVADRLEAALAGRGNRVLRCDGMSAARRFTILVTDKGPEVTPSCPLFQRASAWWHSPIRDESADERFLRAEAWATFSAAAALSRASVINRPSRAGLPGRAATGEIAAAMAVASCDAVRETYVSSADIIGVARVETWGEDDAHKTAPVDEFDPSQPIRTRKVDLDALYEIVAVVGARGFSATTDPLSVELNLVERSVAIARRFEAHFATVTWSVVDGTATPVRFNNAPEEPELRYVWPEILDALCEDLTR
jgi:hypothetical protein